MHVKHHVFFNVLRHHPCNACKTSWENSHLWLAPSLAHPAPLGAHAALDTNPSFRWGAAAWAAHLSTPWARGVEGHVDCRAVPSSHFRRPDAPSPRCPDSPAATRPAPRHPASSTYIYIYMYTHVKPSQRVDDKVSLQLRNQTGDGINFASSKEVLPRGLSLDKRD